MLAVAVALGMFGYARHHQGQAGVNCLFWLGSDRGFLCEWHYPTTNAEPRVVEICYRAGLPATQCYRIEGNRVTDYHFDVGDRLGNEIYKISEPKYWVGESARKNKSDMVPGEFDLCWEETWRPHAMRELNTMTQPFEAEGKGYVAVLAWESIPLGPKAMDAGCVSTDRCTVAVYPLDKVSPAVNALRDAIKVFMADPSTRQHHAAYIRGYPVLSPEQPDNIHTLEGEKRTRGTRVRQRDVLQFIPNMNRMLIPIEKGINPFKAFKTPYIPGSSLMLNYKYQGLYECCYLNGDNFWRVEVYGGNNEQ